MGLSQKNNRKTEFSDNCRLIVNALNKSIEIFTSHSENAFEEVMNLGLKPIADAAGLNRIAVYRLLDKKSGCMGQIYVWAYGKTVTLDKELVELPNVPPVIRWLKVLKIGECINGNAMEMEQDQADFCAIFGVKSILFVPIFTHGEFWGIVTLEDHTNYRYFETNCLDLLRSAARLCASAFIRNETERDAADANELNRATLAIIPVGFTVIDDSLRFIECNDAILNILETTKEYFLNNFFEFSPIKQSNGRLSKDIVHEVHRRAMDGEKFIFEWTHLSASGKLIPFEVTLSSTIYKGSRIVLAYQYDLRSTNNMLENIKEQSRLLRVQLEQQELMSDISKGFISSRDSDMYVKEAIAKLGQYHKVSQVLIFQVDYKRDKACLTHHWSAEAMPFRQIDVDFFGFIKSRFPECLPEFHAVPIIACKDVSMSQDENIRELLAADVNAFISVPLYIEGRLWGVLNVEQLHDPRAWTENEKTFITMTAGLIAGIIMRNLYNKKLKIAVDKATIASRAKSAFLSNMSHEIRTPLNAIIGMTTIGRNTADQERKNYALERIEDASTHLLGVINDILDVSKIEANKFELSTAEFGFEKMLQRVVNVVNLRVMEKKQKFKVHIDRKIPEHLIGDEQRLTQVITNLVGNAVKFTPDEGSIIIDTCYLGEESGLCSIQIKVIDTGIGITAEQQKNLFRSFQQAEVSTSRKYGGTGLGLAISKSIVEMMGGKIWIESEAGKGSTFAFTVRLERCMQRDQSLRERGINRENLRILVVDDDEDTLTFMRETLSEFGVICDTAASGEEALDMLDFNKSYNIYLVDWKLPGIDGIHLSRLLKKRESDPGSVSVIMFSAAAWGTAEEEAKKAGVDKFLSKPFFPSAIRNAINSCLGVDDVPKNEALSPSAPDLKGRKLLLVEDIEINREIVLSLLEPTQLEIDCAENGEVAVQMFRKTPDRYDIIFMDLQMPEMDGLTAARSIRSLNFPKAKTIPIIAMTANVFQEDIEKCLEAGMNNHMGKPLDFDEIMEKLNTYLPDAV